jgi:hypothetical protein
MPTETWFVVIPLLVYLGLTALPAGRPALLGIAAVAVGSAGLSVFGLAGGQSGILAAVGLISGSAIAMAALVQILRRNLGADRSVWVYPALVVMGLIAGAWVMWQQMMGG